MPQDKNKISNQILNYYGATNTAFLHANGKAGTMAMLELLDCKENETVLEVGCGTGATLGLLAIKHPQTRFFGTDISPLMYKKSKARIQFTGLSKKVDISLMKNFNKITFQSDHFDKVYVESVIGIQEKENMKHFLLEIQRVLKPGGALIMNETIWLNTTPLNEIEKINSFCKNAFGIIQSNAHFPFLENWKELLSQLRFEVVHAEKIQDERDNGLSKSPFLFRSSLFDYFGKLKSIFHPGLRRDFGKFKSSMSESNREHRNLMAGFLIKCIKLT